MPNAIPVCANMWCNFHKMPLAFPDIAHLGLLNVAWTQSGALLHCKIAGMSTLVWFVAQQKSYMIVKMQDGTVNLATLICVKISFEHM